MVRIRLLLGLCILSGCSDGEEAPSKEAEPTTLQDSAVADASTLDSSAPALDAQVETRPDARVPDARTPDARVEDSAADAAAPVEVQACTVGPVPAAVRSELKLDAFYKKYADANGLAVLGSDKPSDGSLTSACQLVTSMLAKRDDVRKALITSKARFVIIGKDEGTAEVPEYGYREKSQAERDQINQRARGLGGQVASCGEENILCLKGDRYFNESICVHEFAHTISTYGVFRADRTFEQRLNKSYDSARAAGILANTYRLENVQEYWAEGVQDWYDTNASASPSNGIHNSVNTRAELKSFDPTLYGLVDEVFPTTLSWEDCHAP